MLLLRLRYQSATSCQPCAFDVNDASHSGSPFDRHESSYAKKCQHASVQNISSAITGASCSTVERDANIMISDVQATVWQKPKETRRTALWRKAEP